jgi:iron complex transport system substrate-binding protein
MTRRCTLFAIVFFLAVLPAAGQITITDDLQRTIRLEGPARRVISLAPSITESLFAIGAGESVVGVTQYCDYPREAKSLPHVGGMINPSLEAIVALRPDLIVLSMEGNMRDDFRRLTSMGMNVFVTNPRTLDDIHRSLLALGTLTGRTDSATKVVARMVAREAELRARATGTPVRTLFIVSMQPLLVAGRNTFLNELITAAGGYNLAMFAQGTYPAYSRETLVANNPDVLLVTSDVVQRPADILTLFPEWRNISAVRHNRVFRVDASLMMRPGPRAVDAIASLLSLLRPQP